MILDALDVPADHPKFNFSSQLERLTRMTELYYKSGCTFIPKPTDSRALVRMAFSAKQFISSIRSRFENFFASAIASRFSLIKNLVIAISTAFGLYKTFSFAFAPSKPKAPAGCKFESFLFSKGIFTDADGPKAVESLCNPRCSKCLSINFKIVPNAQALTSLAVKFRHLGKSEAGGFDSGDAHTRFRSKTNTSAKKNKNKSKSQGLFGCWLHDYISSCDRSEAAYMDLIHIYGGLCWINCEHCPKILAALQKDEIHFVPFNADEKQKKILAQKVFDVTKKYFATATTNSSSEAFYDTNAVELTKSKIYANMYRVNFGSRGAINGLFVKGRCMLLNYHAIPHIISNHGYFSLSNAFTGKSYDIQLDECEIYNLSHKDGSFKDAVILALPKYIPSHKDISHHFMAEKRTHDFVKVNASLVTIEEINDKSYHNNHSMMDVLSMDEAFIDTHEYKKDNLLDYTDLDPLTGNLNVIHMKRAYIYNAQTKRGDCGSPLIANCPSLQSKILGIHVSSNASAQCSAVPIYHDELVEAFSKLPSESQCSFTIPPEFTETYDVDMPKGSFIPLGKTPRKYITPSKTTLRPSPIFELVTPATTRPALLRPKMINGVLHEPLRVGLEKCGKPTVKIPQKYIDRAYDNFKPLVLSNINPLHQQILSFEQAITGVPDELHMDPLNRRSSPGYPWVDKTQGQPGKTKWLGETDYILDNEELLFAVADRLRLARNGERKFTPWINCLKDERREHQKVDAGKTRCFTCGPMDYLILFRQYFLGYFAHMMTNRIDNESGVGMDPKAFCWTRAASKLRKFGIFCVAGDFSNYDGSLNAQILWKILDLINEFYDDGPENALIRTVLWFEVVNSVHIFEDIIFQWTHSQPSGNPGTTHINTQYQSLAVRIVFQIIMENEEYDISDFNNLVSLLEFGDDGVMNIHPDILHLFNQDTIAAAFASIGMTYTDESKGKNDCAPYRTLSEISFLKRSFVYDDVNCRFLAPLELPVILEMCNWVRKDLDQAESCIANVETAFDELAQHDKETFDFWTKKLVQACKLRLNRCPYLRSFEEYRDMHRD